MWRGEVSNAVNMTAMVIIHTNIKTLGATKNKSKFYQHMYIKYLFLIIVMKKKWYAITLFLEIELKNPSSSDVGADQYL